MPFKHLHPSRGGAIRVTLSAYTGMPPPSTRSTCEGRTHSIMHPQVEETRLPATDCTA